MARLGLKLFYLRSRERGLSQRQVAESIGVRQATLSYVEQGITMPNCALLLELSRFYDVTPTFLLDEARGVVPRVHERWRHRDALVTAGSYVEAPRTELVTTADGKILCPLLVGERFFDAEAVELRRGARSAEAADAAIDARMLERDRGEAELAAALEAELLAQTRKRRGSARG
jgi:transcriptional regulator with XRE-family HTH domain